MTSGGTPGLAVPGAFVPGLPFEVTSTFPGVPNAVPGVGGPGFARPGQPSFLIPPFLPGGAVTVTAAGPVAAQASIAAAGPLAVQAGIATHGPLAAQVTVTVP